MPGGRIKRADLPGHRKYAKIGAGMTVHNTYFGVLLIALFYGKCPDPF